MARRPRSSGLRPETVEALKVLNEPLPKAKRSIINTNTKTDPDKQRIATPWCFIHALEVRFGTPVDFDLAADDDNAKAPGLRYFTEKHDALKTNWGPWLGQSLGGVGPSRLAYLNPPFANIKPWADKLAECRYLPRWTVMLAPSSFDANWFHELKGKVQIDAVPRMVFEGSKELYPKGLALYIAGFGVNGVGGYWDWVTDYYRYCSARGIECRLPKLKKPILRPGKLPDFDGSPDPFYVP